jgi:hypothetical protein
MTEAVFDFADINRRMNRKPEPVKMEAPVQRRTAYDIMRGGKSPEELMAEYFKAYEAWTVLPSNWWACPPTDPRAVRALYEVAKSAVCREEVDIGAPGYSVPAVRKHLDDNETVFIGWDVSAL